MSNAFSLPVQAVEWSCHAATTIKDADGVVLAEIGGNGRRLLEDEAIAAEIVRRVNAHDDLLAAVRPLVSMTLHQARDAERSYKRVIFCQCDVLNPCWDASYSASGWGEHGPGKHWGGGDACPECNLRAAVAKATRSGS